MHKFAHLADLHLGAFRHPKLQQLVLESFNKAIDACIETGIDFVVVSGDLFDSNMPDMSIVKAAVSKIRELRDRGIEFYIAYGSHDSSPTQTSIADVLESTGLFKRITRGNVVKGKLELEFHTDSRTGAKLCGIPGRRLGIEREYFAILNRERLEREGGFKIFAFHGALNEYKPKHLAAMESMAISYLPKGFDYYAGGHLHDCYIGKAPGYECVVYPGTIFGGDYRDLEGNARGQKRGFYIVSFSEKLEKVEFNEIVACKYGPPIDYNADGKSATKVQADLSQAIKNIDAEGKLMLLKVQGELSSGRTSDIQFSDMRQLLEEKGAIHVLMNYHQLTSREYSSIKVAGEDISSIETRLFKESIGNVRVSNPQLKGDECIKLARNLLDTLRREKKENETKDTYEKRILRDALEIMGLLEVAQ